jgi:thioredoxin reductase (NADPH)
MHDLIIIGAGPAGITAAVYAARRKLSTLVLESQAAGGQMLLTSEIENYPGFGSITGAELSKRFEEHARSLGVEIRAEQAAEIKRSNGGFSVRTEKNNHEANAVIIATGAKHRSLGIAGEDKFVGKGVSFCATCDGYFFRKKKVVVVGGGESALTAALYLADIASKVYLVHRRAQFRGSELLQERTRRKGIETLTGYTAKEIRGDGMVSGVLLESAAGEKKELAVDGVFIYIGTVPLSALAQSAGVALDERGFIKTDEQQRTSVPGVFAAGDVTGRLLQIVAACAQGAQAALSAYDYVKGKE